MRDELLALLEEGPSSHTDLAKVLSRPREQVRHELRAMFEGGQVTRHDNRWCLPGYVPPPPPSRQYPNSQEARVVAAVGAGHQHVHSVSRATGLPTGTSSAVLSALCRKGQIVRLRREFGPNGMPIHIYGLPPKAIPRTAEDLQLKVCHQCGKGFDPHSRHSQCPACREPTASFAGKREVPRSRLCLDCLPSGSGIDCGVTIDLDRSHSDRLVFNTSYHHMEDGSYDGWTSHTIAVRPSFVTRMSLTISGPDRNGIKDYLYDVMYMALATRYEQTSDGYARKDGI